MTGIKSIILAGGSGRFWALSRERFHEDYRYIVRKACGRGNIVRFDNVHGKN